MKSTRLRRRLTQQELGAMVDLGQSEISYLERGHGARTSIETWVALGIALDRPIGVGFGRDVVAPLSDAGHLAAQELVARLASAAGWRVGFEAPNDPRAPTGHTDLRLERIGELALVEIWNRMDDLGEAFRSSDRKAADVGRSRRRATTLWLLLDTAANRRIIRAYPAIFRARFPGSSASWVQAVTTGSASPRGPGIAWVDVRSGRLRELRLAAPEHRKPADTSPPAAERTSRALAWTDPPA
jgi:transcriptional regulator with XRE-family HTH domain